MQYDKITLEVSEEITNNLVASGIVRFSLNEFTTNINAAKLKLTMYGNVCQCTLIRENITFYPIFTVNLFNKNKTLYSAYQHCHTGFDILIETLIKRHKDLTYTNLSNDY